MKHGSPVSDAARGWAEGCRLLDKEFGGARTEEKDEEFGFRHLESEGPTEYFSVAV